MSKSYLSMGRLLDVHIFYLQEVSCKILQNYHLRVTIRHVSFGGEVGVGFHKVVFPDEYRINGLCLLVAYPCEWHIYSHLV